MLALAAGMTYYSLLAIFPAIAAQMAIYGLSPIRWQSPGTWTSFEAKPLRKSGSLQYLLLPQGSVKDSVLKQIGQLDTALKWPRQRAPE